VTTEERLAKALRLLEQATSNSMDPVERAQWKRERDEVLGR
jgi:hypothetical protein